MTVPGIPAVMITKSMAQEGLVSEQKAKSGRAIHVQLTRKGNQYRERLIKSRVAADENVRHQLTADERAVEYCPWGEEYEIKVFSLSRLQWRF